MKKATVYLFLLIYTFLSAQNLVKNIDISFDEVNFLENSPEKTTDSYYKIIEFWATWCVPCVQQIPHINELSKEFSSDEVMFLSVSDEKESTILNFTKKFPIDTYLVSDSEKIWREKFNVKSIPATFLVDPEGKIQWSGNPNDLSKHLIQKFIKGDDIGGSAPPEMEEILEMDDDLLSDMEQAKKYNELLKDPKICEFSQINYKSSNVQMYSWVDDSLSNPIVWFSQPLKEIIQFIPEYKNYIFKPNDNLNSKTATVYYKDCNVEDPKIKWNRFKDSLKTQLKIDWKFQLAEKELYILNVIDPSKIEYAEKAAEGETKISKMSESGNMTIFENNSVEILVKYLGAKSDIVIINETKIMDNINLVLKTNSLNEIEESLSKYGLELKKEVRKMNEIEIFQTN